MGCVSNLNGKAMTLEREKAKLQAEIEEAIVAVEDAEARCMAMEKKARNFDKIVTEWKNKIEGLQSELDQTQVECRSYSTGLFKVKTTYDETNGQLEGVRHENRRSLECQVKDMQTKLDEAEQQAVKGGRKVTSRLEQKIKDLESQFDDEQRRLVEAEKSQRRTTRRIKELTFSQEEDHKNER